MDKFKVNDTDVAVATAALDGEDSFENTFKFFDNAHTGFVEIADDVEVKRNRRADEVAGRRRSIIRHCKMLSEA